MQGRKREREREVMAGSQLLSHSATLVMLMVVELLLQSSVQRVKIINPSLSLAVASNADVKLFSWSKLRFTSLPMYS